MLEGLTPPPKRAHICKFANVRSVLSSSDQKILDEAMADTESWPTETLLRELKKRGLDVGRETLRLHRRGDCVCVKL